ncbi:hypothetical protein H1D32_05330 [Anaerobacillus sp. CMMVII]|uniref:hypothetical protein n=1 Tax=Anaerobacillus sp. CMMVII TaxID=2755588 RepID=UPI0021B72938|nr:hypothetical protein [Anaerobacillus sp. CMMVII]MCT8137212.1 hypothetical protein [Anaerobacillus sp. CMMVII]
MSLMIHQLISILFLAVVPLPIIAFLKSRNGQPLESAPIWKGLVMLANLALFVTLITGFILFPEFTSIRVWVSVALILALGAFLGIFSKRLKLYRLEKNDEVKRNHLDKIAKIGFIYIATLIGTFILMFNWYNL